MQDIDPDDIIIIDESGSDLSQTRNYARVEGGQRARAPKPHISKERFSIVAAISTACIVAAMYVDTAINGNIFKTYIEKNLAPKLKPGKYVVMDNIAFHKSEAVRKLIEGTGAKLVFLPPYSPDLSPIEKMWSKVKEIIKKFKPRTKGEFHNALFNAMSSVTSGDLESWYCSSPQVNRSTRCLTNLGEYNEFDQHPAWSKKIYTSRKKVADCQ